MISLASSFIVLSAWILVPFTQPAVLGVHFQNEPSASDSDDVPKKKIALNGRGTFTLTKETTYATEPIDHDGRVDYVAALNKRLRKGIKPENNANVLIWKAFGPHPEGANMPPAFFHWLGVPAPPEEGDYLIPLFKHVTEHLQIPREQTVAIYTQLDLAMKAPWKEKDYPEIASWLKANEKPLAVFVEASKRPAYYSPLVPSEFNGQSSGLVGSLLPAVQKTREASSALIARAMLRLGEGRDGVWEDLLACHRLARLVGQGGTLIEGLVGIAIDAIATESDLAFLAHTKPNARQLAKYRHDLRKLPALPDMAEKIDLTERFVMLDSCMMIDRHGYRYVAGIIGGRVQANAELIDQALNGIDWDPALRTTNRFCDRLAEVMREKTRARRQKGLNQIEQEIGELKQKLGNDELGGLLVGNPATRGKTFGQILVTLFLPAVTKVQTASDRAAQTQTNLILAFALEQYHRDHDHYPKELTALAPTYMKEIPKDIFSGKALIYRPRENGYLFYSVGMNGEDEEGRGYGDDPRGDDLAVRMPR